MIDMTPERIKVFVDLHNQNRERVANGSLSHLPEAARMQTIVNMSNYRMCNKLVLTCTFLGMGQSSCVYSIIEC